MYLSNTARILPQSIKHIEFIQTGTGILITFHPNKMAVQTPQSVKTPPLADHDSSVLDLAFGMDCTASMGSYIHQAQQVSLRHFVFKVQTSHPHTSLSVDLILAAREVLIESRNGESMCCLPQCGMCGYVVEWQLLIQPEPPKIW